MSNERIVELLTQIKGVVNGQMFSLGREDAFAVDDYGLQTTM